MEGVALEARDGTWRGARVLLIGAGPGLDQSEAQLDALGPRRPIVVRRLDLDALRADDRIALASLRLAIEHEAKAHALNLVLAALPAAMRSVLGEIESAAARVNARYRFLPTLDDVLAGHGSGRTQAPSTWDLAALIGRPARAIDESIVREVVTGRRVLITGAGGSIGSEIARQCAAFEPSSLALMDRSENALFEIDREIATNHPALDRQARLNDVVDVEATALHLRSFKPDVVFHAAAHKHVPLMQDHPAAAIANNLFGTKSVADAALACGADRFVMISTDKAVNPSSVMGATKRMAEHYVRSLNACARTRFCLVRFGNVLGSACSVLPIWSRQVSEGGPVTVTDPRMTRYFMTIPEAAALVVQAAGAEPGADVFVLDMGEPIRIVDLATRFVAMLGLEPDIADPAADPARTKHVGSRAHMPIVFTGARPGEKLDEELAHEAERLSPTRVPGVRAWQGEPVDRDDVEAMIQHLRSVGTTTPPGEVIQAIEHHVPLLSPEKPEQIAEMAPPGPGTRVGSHAA